MHKLLKSTLFASVLILLISGCASHENFTKKYNSWVSKDISYLVQQIGYPDSTYLLPNKNKVYVYEKSTINSFPSMSMMGGYGYGGYGHYGMFGYGTDIVQKSCKLFIETNKKGIIVKWGSRGNSCVSNK